MSEQAYKTRLKFNTLAAKDSKLFNIVSELKTPFYIDRLQGGAYIDDYIYDPKLLRTYRELLGNNFWGFQMHEWLSNYRGDVRKLEEPLCENWTARGIEEYIFKKFPFPCLFLESMTAEEMAHYGRPTSYDEFYSNMTAIYRKRTAEVGTLLPCDSYFLAYPFEFDAGADRVMPEVGAQTPDAKIQICLPAAKALPEKRASAFTTKHGEETLSPPAATTRMRKTNGASAKALTSPSPPQDQTEEAPARSKKGSFSIRSSQTQSL